MTICVNSFSNFFKFFIFVSCIFISEVNGKSAHSHLESLEVVQLSLEDCSNTVDELISFLYGYTTPSSAAVTESSVIGENPVKVKHDVRRLPPSIQNLKATDWQNYVDATLTLIDLTIDNIDSDLENETNARILGNETAALKSLIDYGERNPFEVKRSDIYHLLNHSYATRIKVEDELSTVDDEYDKYDKQRKITISLSTLSAVIVITLVIIMIVIYTKKMKKNDSDSSSSNSEVSSKAGKKKEEDSDVETDPYTSYQEKFGGIPRVKTTAMKTDQQPSTSYASSSTQHTNNNNNGEGNMRY